jgi:hypothetical protein
MSKETETTQTDSYAPLSGVVESGEFMDRDCSNCKTTTRQKVQLYNPDDLEDGEVWECTQCKENTGWASW